MRKRRNIALAVLILAVLTALVLSLSACAKQKATASLEPYTTPALLPGHGSSRMDIALC